MKAILTIICLFIQLACFAQATISISESRIYFAEGGSKEQTIIVKNTDNNDTLKINLSFHDWEYDNLGNNQIYNAGELNTSLASYLTIPSGSYMTLTPGMVDTIRVSIKQIPEDSVTVRTAMLYLTQLDNENKITAAIKSLVQIGVKFYYKNNEYPKPQIQLSNFNLVQNEEKTKKLRLLIYNSGNTWLDGVIHYELLNLDTREMIKIGKTEFSSLPADKRQVKIDLPTNLKSGNYKAYAFVNPLTNNGINNLELTFTN